MQEAIDAGYREILFRKVIQMMIEEQMIFCGHILIHRFSDVQELFCLNIQWVPAKMT